MTLGICLLAGASLTVAGRLALSMLALQLAIGALNDRVDWARDAAEKPGKPIPAGVATRGEASALAAVGGGLGLLLSSVSGAPTLLVAALGLGLGFAYDLRLSRSSWSWAPLALALPLLPVHAWLGATGTVPPGLLALVPTAVIAGAALALGNGLVDLERDARSNRRTAAVTLGSGPAWLLHVLLLAAVAGLAVFLAPTIPAGPELGGGTTSPVPLGVLKALRTWAMLAGLAALALGAAALRVQRPAVRERGWELEAVGVAGVGLGWLAGTAAAGGGT